MDNESQLGSQEFDLFIELIITILFMTICAVFTSQMITKMNKFSNLYYREDKINISNEQHKAYDPFYMNGYTALMYGWVYDNQSTVPITWLGDVKYNGKHLNYAEPSRSDLDYAEHMQVSSNIDDIGEDTVDTNYAMLCSVHHDGSPISNFDTWKTQVIAGSTTPSSIGYYNNVIKTMMSAASVAAINDASNNKDDFKYYALSNSALYGAYRGMLQRNLRISEDQSVLATFKYRLVYTDKYNSSIDHSQYTERKLKQWVIIPVYVQ